MHRMRPKSRPKYKYIINGLDTNIFKKKTIALKVEVARKLNWLSKAFIFID